MKLSIQNLRLPVFVLMVVLCLPGGRGNAQAPAATTYYVCDCAAGADEDCEPGDDAHSGSSPADAWRTYEQARSQFGSLAAGDAIRFCRGGAFDLGSAGTRWVNQNCRADNRCTVGAYDPAWGSGDAARPILRRSTDSHGFALEDGGNAEHEEGYIIENLDLRCSGCDNANGFFIYNDMDDVLIENVSIDGFGIGVHLAGSNPCSADPDCNGMNERLVVRGATITNNGSQGFLGGGDGLVIEDSYFENNGGGTMFDHNIYVSSGDNVRIAGNELYRSSLDGDGLCQGVSLVGHGGSTGLTIENNFVHEPVGGAGQGCWGIAIDPAYDRAERFENLVIRGNRVVNVGNLAIGVGACVNCLIENNVVIHRQAFGVIAIAAPDRAPGSGDAETTNVTVRNNSILIGDSGGQGIRISGEGTGHRIVSNALQYTGSSNSWECLRADLPAGSYEAIDYNVCGFETGEWAADVGDLAAWRALGWDLHSKAADPGFAGDDDLSPASAQSAVVNAGHPTLSSPDDITGRPRDETIEAGAYEFVPDLRLSGIPGNRTITLNWTVNAILPVTSTWTINYQSANTAYLPISGLTNTLRAYTLTDLSNGFWHTVTLNAMLNATPILTDTVRVMPASRFVYLPLVLR
ncbi:MAG: right-handed parallel beta-helix repeat-containing protein [Anaerolineae bacterium]|nr:right-handed parallel beta-helix repeat-containing protein [Anaerolineae bacterium]